MAKALIRYLLLLTSIGTFGSTELIGQWYEISAPPNQFFSTMNTNGNDLFVGTWGGMPYTSHLYRSIAGLPWEPVDSGLSIQGVYMDVAFTDRFLFVATQNGFFRSSNYGDTWVSIHTGSVNQNYSSAITVTNPSSDTPYVFVAANAEGIFRSKDYGNSWMRVNSGLGQKWVNSFALKDSFLFAGVPRLGSASKGCVYRSSNYGDSWISVTSGLTDSSIQTLATTPFGVLAGTWSGGVFLSTDHGDAWQPVNDDIICDTVHTLATSGSTVIAGTRQGVYFSLDSCRSWREGNAGLPAGAWIYHLACTPRLMFAGLYPDSGLWMRPLSELVTDETTTDRVPDHFWLGQNHPNPFNANSSISFSLPTDQDVTLQVYDLQGRLIATLLNQRLHRGRHGALVDGSDWSSGIYFYNLRADKNTVTRKMILLK